MPAVFSGGNLSGLANGIERDEGAFLFGAIARQLFVCGRLEALLDHGYRIVTRGEQNLFGRECLDSHPV